ncbi:hypothetical protein AHMF7605_09925 [Adhaeribacter arboris]|uniref:DUF3592 domain-containing protein n=1 Tax=Adhaeribacter arboris TaxID=2072846 RepID=A0A2T2YE74_9BACT|nr:hypothetical protein [Adhaeribacter arboris]PSR53815.1 hypothetical protein AHMF7605_09925 [Adhaeribacter arboris]
MFFELLLLLCAAIFIGTGMNGLIEARERAKSGFHTNAVVVKLVGEWSRSNSKITYLYYPIIKFKDKAGTDVEGKLEVGTFPPFYYTGQKITIIYFENQIFPSSRFSNAVGWLIILLGLGILAYGITQLY